MIVRNNTIIRTIQLGAGLESFVMANNNGMRITIINYGATIASIEVPDRFGKSADVVLGYPELKNYIGGRFYLGATIGRYANRIERGRFTLDGKAYQLSVNSKGNHLHGGTNGFDKKFWNGRVVECATGPVVELSLRSCDGEEGFPGTMDVRAKYELTSENELTIEYYATTDKLTIINMTNHVYFNLAGPPATSILDHVLTIHADAFTATDNYSLPTGEIRNVENTPLDFRKPIRIGDRIDSNYDQLKFAGGYDQNFILAGVPKGIESENNAVRNVASVYDPSTGRVMEVSTDQPGMQFYSGNNLDGTVVGKGNAPLSRRSGFCLECQHYPDAPNHPGFPSVVLAPGETYRQRTSYKFLIQ